MVFSQAIDNLFYVILSGEGSGESSKVADESETGAVEAAATIYNISRLCLLNNEIDNKTIVVLTFRIYCCRQMWV